MKIKKLVSLMLVVFISACGGGSDSKPDEGKVNRAPVISGQATAATEGADYSFIPQVSDPDNDPLTLSISNKPSWAAFNSNTGELSGKPTADNIGLLQDIVISVSDGRLSSDLKFDLSVEFNPLEEAIRTGKASLVTQEQVYLDGIMANIADTKNRFNAAKQQIFQLGSDGQAVADSLTSIIWSPTWDASLLGTTFGFNDRLLETNSTFDPNYAVKQKTIGIIGEQDNRYIFLGSNPMRNWHRSVDSINDQMHQMLQNSLSWLTARNDLKTAPFKVVIAQMSQNYYFPDQVAVRSWLDTYYKDSIAYNEATSCNGAKLAACLTTDVDLLIISQYLLDNTEISVIKEAVEQAAKAGVPVLYMHLDGYNGDLAKAIFPLFHVQYQLDNYWQRLQLDNFNPVILYGQLSTEITQVNALIQAFKNNAFNIDFSGCSNKSCPDSSNYQTEFKAAAAYIKTVFNQLDANKVRIFDDGNYRFHKLLILLADFYRQSIQYPMDKITTDSKQFLQSLYADHTVYNFRTINPAQADMGNFSRSDFSHVTASEREVYLTSKPNFRSAGVYALPGQTFTVQRLDSTEVTTKVFINSLRSGATHEFDQDAYSRPKYLQSQAIEIKAGETISITSAYGGPVQISFDRKDLEVGFKFSNIGAHPIWRSAEDNASFTAALEAGDYDWTELVTASFEVHSKLEKMRQTVADPRWGDAAKLSSTTNEYTHNYVLQLAGYDGPGIDVISEVESFVTDNQLTKDSVDRVQHMNADQATCGYGCSGNPYDAYWSFSPVAHGDLHEVGHGLERSLFRPSGWEVHTTTNLYSYYAKTQFYLNTGNPAQCQSLPFAELFETLKASKSSADPFAYMQANAGLNVWSRGVSFYLQLMMAGQQQNALASGWNLWPRLHILERNFRKARADETSWNEAAAKLGFAGWTLAEAKAISSNDWLMVSASHSLKRDARGFFTVWGLSFSAKADAQVAAYGFDALSQDFYLANQDDFCLGLAKDSVAISADMSWPF